MLELVLTVCLASFSGPCHEERFKIFEEEMSLIQCMMGMQNLPKIEKWKKDNPGWTVKESYCHEYKEDEKEL